MRADQAHLKVGMALHMIVGLGNPGTRYAATRHNVGFKVIEVLARALQTKVAHKEGKALTGRAMYQGVRVMLVKPQTFMNNSGQALQLLSDYYKIPPEKMLIIFDDLDLPVGRLRLRAKGSAGGHNGARSVIQYLGTDSFPRLRIGISAVPADMRGMDYVLSPFSPEEKPVITKACATAADAALCWLYKGLEKTMAHYNAV